MRRECELQLVGDPAATEAGVLTILTNELLATARSASVYDVTSFAVVVCVKWILS